MATIVQTTIPTGEYALAETFQTCSAATVECEQVIEQPSNTVMPLVWVREINPDTFEAALAEDPTVGTYTQLADSEAEWLYEMEWRGNVQLVLELFTIEGAVILDAVGSSDGWQLRVFFPHREDVEAITAFCEARDLTITIDSIRELDGETARQGAARFGLTDDQYEALTLAYNQGYFSVPSVVGLNDLAEELDISHQALSERLRDGYETLIGETLLSRPTLLTAD